MAGRLEDMAVNKEVVTDEEALEAEQADEHGKPEFAPDTLAEQEHLKP